MQRCVVLVSLIACGGARSSTEPTPIAKAPEPAARAWSAQKPAADPDALCCCTFAFAEAEDFPDIATWDSLATTCPTGDASRMPGRCIDWQWCGHPAGQHPRTLADRPDLAPTPPLPATSCCCDIWDGTGETFHVRDTAACAATPEAACVASEFCDVPSAQP